MTDKADETAEKDWLYLYPASRYARTNYYRLKQAVENGDIPAHLVKGKQVVLKKDLDHWVTPTPLPVQTVG